MMLSRKMKTKTHTQKNKQEWSHKTILHQLRIMDNKSDYLFKGKTLQITIPNKSPLIINRKLRI